jgi:hypothetical protein
METTRVGARTVGAGNVLSPPVAIDNGMFAGYSQVAAAAGPTSFALTWSSSGAGGIEYRAVDASGALIGTMPVNAQTTVWDDNARSIVGVTDGFLLVTTMMGSATSLHLVHLGCP